MTSNRRTVYAERIERVMVVQLENPPRNYMNAAMVGELDELVRLVEGDPTIGAVVITGAPEDVFVTHYDVVELERGASMATRALSGPLSTGLRAVGALRRLPGAGQALGRSPAAGLANLHDIHDLFNRMNRLDKVVIAAINGLAAGGGCELALACDVRIMADAGLPIGLPESTLGLIPGAGGTQRLARMLGPSRALEMMLEGRLLQPLEALDVGLVHRVVEPAALMDEALATAERLSRRSPTAVREIKRAVYDGAARPLADGLHIERAGFVNAASSPETQRAMDEYVEQTAASTDKSPVDSVARLEQWRQGTVVDMTGEG